MGAAESIPGQPVAGADISYGMDRERTISEAGLGFPSPEPRTADGPLTGIWLSSYEYRSSGRDASYIGRHYVIVMQRGAVLTIRSVEPIEVQARDQHERQRPRGHGHLDRADPG